MLFRTSDGGLTWDVQYRSDPKLTDVQFTDLRHGWFTVGASFVYRTTDGGDTWCTCPCNVEYSNWSQFHRIDMLDSRHGWAVGTNGGILATSDGEHWVIEKSGTTRTLWGISFVDPANGWTADDGGVILKDPGPLAYAPYRSTVRRGAIATLKYKISDAAVVRLSIVIHIRNGHKRPVKKLALANKAPNRLLSARFRCRLARGKYTFHVSAIDSAGMKTAVPAVNRLTVR